MAPSKQRKLQPPPVNIQPFVATLKADPSKLSLLLDLPAKLRNTIYELIINSHDGVKLSHQPSHRGLGYPVSTLNRVNKQVHHEFTSAAFLLADIHTEARGYDFRHLVTFMNSLSADDLPALPSIHSTRSGRTITVTLHPGYANEEPAFLTRWINRAAHPTKKGTSVRFEYLVPSAWRGTSGTIWCPLTHQYIRTPFVDARAVEWQKRAEAMPAGRKREEFEKIIAAVS